MPKNWRYGPIAAAIAGKPAGERARIKAKEIVKAVKLAKLKPQNLGAAALGGEGATPDMEWNVVHDAETMVVSIYTVAEDDNGAVLLRVQVQDGQGAARAFSNPLIVLNPPVMAPDGTTYTEIDEDGNVMTLPNMVEDPVGALRLVVADAVRMQL